MNRSQLEHVIRAASTIADDEELIIVGTQAVLGQFPDPPAELVASVDVDLYPKNRPERADLIDGSIGELSPFHQTYGYYAHGVGTETSVLPQGWQDRLVPVRSESTRGATGWCVELHDLLVAKAVAGREKDLRFLESVASHGFADRKILLDRLEATQLDDDVRQAVEARLKRVFLVS